MKKVQTLKKKMVRPF